MGAVRWREKEGAVDRVLRAVIGAGVIAGSLFGATALWAEPAKGGAETPQTVQDGKAVQIDYTLRVDGEVVDTSEGRGPLRYVHGQGQLIPGLERQLVGLHAGDTRSVTVSPEEGYGAVDPEAFVDVSKEQLAQDVTLEVGTALQGTSPDGKPFRAQVHEVDAESVTLDLNHPLAGKTLEFDITVVEVSEAP